jgi:hypothetical protein
METEQDCSSGNGCEMLTANHDRTATQIVDAPHAKQRFLGYEPAMIGEQRQGDAPPVPSDGAPTRSPGEGAAKPPSSDEAVGDSQSGKHLSGHRKWESTEHRRQPCKPTGAVEHIDADSIGNNSRAARFHRLLSAAGSFDRTRLVNVPSVSSEPSSKSRLSSNTTPNFVSHAMSTSSNSTESSQYPSLSRVSGPASVGVRLGPAMPSTSVRIS